MALFLAGLSALWFGCTDALREIVGEHAIYKRERMAGLRLSAYIMSKLLVGLGLCSIQCTILAAMTVWGCNLQSSVLDLFLILMMVASTGLAIGLFLSAVATTTEVAIGLLSLALIPIVVFGGALLPIHKMHATTRAVAFTLPMRSGFEALLENEAKHRPRGPSSLFSTTESPQDSLDPTRLDIAEVYFPTNRRLGIATCAELLALMSCTLITAVVLALRLREI